MLFLSKPSVFFLPGTWEAQESVVSSSTTHSVIASIFFVVFILFWAIYIIPRKMKRD
jgi:cytochrome c oxidase assembly factor CtaG